MDQSAYDFINQTGGGSDTGKKKRIIVAAVGLLFLISIGVLFFVLMFGNKQDTNQLLLPIAASQQDLIDITDAGLKDARDNKLLNASSSTNLVLASHSNITKGYLGKDGSKAIKAYQNAEYKKALDEAASSGTFDKSYEAILSQRLDLYRQQLVTAYSKVEDAKVKKQLAVFSDEANTLAGEPSTPN
jgi:hypothetical protein